MLSTLLKCPLTNTHGSLELSEKEGDGDTHGIKDLSVVVVLETTEASENSHKGLLTVTIRASPPQKKVSVSRAQLKCFHDNAQQYGQQTGGAGSHSAAGK